jgi:tripartite-type tricarboxylate transporter receptor subunit TctC
LLASSVVAQDFPSKPFRWVIPYSPGGATDITARTLSPHMSQTLGQQVVVENRAGGAAIRGMEVGAGGGGGG